MYTVNLLFFTYIKRESAMMGVRMKLGLSYLAMVLMIVFLGIFALWSMSNMQKSTDDAAVAALKYMKQSDNMNVAVSDYRAAMYKLLTAETPAQKTASYAEIRKTAKTIDDTFAKMSDGIAFVDKLNEAKDNWAKTQKHGEKAIALVEAGDTPAASIYMRDEMGKDYMALNTNTDELAQMELDKAQSKVAAADEIYHGARTATIIVLIVIALLTVGIGYYFYLLIGGFLSKFLEVSQRVYNGDMTVHLAYDTPDEFGKIAHSYNDTLDKIRGITAEIQKISNELTHSAETMSTGVNESAQVVTSIAESINDIAGLSLSQNKNVDRASSALDNIITSVNQVADLAKHTADNATEVGTTVTQGIEGINVINQHMDRIETMVSTSANQVDTLGHRSEEIGQIVETIVSISGQTNLLALNAAIEAARAGEHGRGFAVVAEEIRKLAENSQEAAQHIAQLIGTIQEETKQAVEAMHHGNEGVRQGSEVVKEAMDEFSQVTGMVDNMVAQMGKVAEHIKQVSTQSDQVIEAATCVSQDSDKIAGETQQVSAASEEQSATMQELSNENLKLTDMSKRLQDQLKVFRT